MEAKPTLINLEINSILSCAMLGVGMLTLPRGLTEQATTTDGWIILILNGICAALLLILLVYMLKKHRVTDYFSYIEEAYGKWAGKAICLALAVYFLSIASFEVRAMSEMVRFYMLENTPMEVTILALILAAVHLIIGGIKPIAKVCILFLPITIVVVLFIYSMSFKVVDLMNIKPILGYGLQPILKGFSAGQLSFFGIELVLFLYGMTDKKLNINKGVLLGCFIPVGMYVLTYILVVSTLTIDEVTSVTWPTISFIQSFEVQGIFVERLELFLLVTWILQFFTTHMLYFYFAAKSMTHVFHNRFSTNLIILVPLIFLLANYAKDLGDVFIFSDLLGFAFPVVLIILPFVTFFVYGLKRRMRT
ncbi:GerAB/ArcD/ProY family transporter [Cytobacillus gottheilii]|uniref:GerAB/ArcD/ProY family transporter n=1 Tax=Cytobacillus gottheilii TaxID=859144 RepID=UPI003CFAC7DC